jgi:hypothetical protein
MESLPNSKMYASWMLYIQILNDINNLPVYSFTKSLLNSETKAEAKALIIKQHCQMYNLKIKE